MGTGQWWASCVVAIGVLAGGAAARGAVIANLLTNPSFESPDVAPNSDSAGSTGWSGFNFTFTNEDFPAHDGSQTLKMFGPWGDWDGSGVVQGGFAATPGQTWEASAWLRNPSTDAMSVENFAVVKIEFLDATGTIIGAPESTWFTGAAPTDTWELRSVQGVAPVGTVSAQIVLVHVQAPPINGGSVVFDDASFGLAQVPEPTAAAVAGLAFAALGMRRRRVR